MDKIIKDFKEKLGLDLVIDLAHLTAIANKPTPKAKYTTFKRVFGIKFQSKKNLIEYINEYLIRHIKFIEDKKVFKQEQKIKVKNKSNNIQEGDIFVSSWGYEQTNVNAYQVIERKSLTVKLMKIGLISLEDTSWGSDTVKPNKDDFISDEIITKRLSGDYIKFSSFEFANLYKKGETYHRSWYA